MKIVTNNFIAFISEKHRNSLERSRKPILSFKPKIIIIGKRQILIWPTVFFSGFCHSTPLKIQVEKKEEGNFNNKNRFSPFPVYHSFTTHSTIICYWPGSVLCTSSSRILDPYLFYDPFLIHFHQYSEWMGWLVCVCVLVVNSGNVVFLSFSPLKRKIE